MKHWSKQLDAPAVGPSTGAELPVGDFRDKTVQFAGTFTATYEIWGRIGGGPLQKVSTVSGAGFYTIAENLTAIAIRCTVTGSVASVFFGGLNTRAD